MSAEEHPPAEIAFGPARIEARVLETFVRGAVPFATVQLSAVEEQSGLTLVSVITAVRVGDDGPGATVLLTPVHLGLDTGPADASAPAPVSAVQPENRPETPAGDAPESPV